MGASHGGKQNLSNSPKFDIHNFAPYFYQKWMVTNHPRVGHCFFSARGAAPFHLHPFSRQAAKACAELFPPGFLTCGGCQLPMNATSKIPMGYCNSRKHGLVNHDSSTPSLGWAIGIYESTFGGHDILPCCHKLRCMISTRNCQHFSVCWLHLNIRTIKQKHFFSIILHAGNGNLHLEVPSGY